MTMRTTSRTVTFDNSFCLAGFDEEFPSGDYLVETDEELLQGLSFAAYRRVQTMLHVPPPDRSPGRKRVLSIHPEALDAALEGDRSPAANTRGHSPAVAAAARRRED